MISGVAVYKAVDGGMDFEFTDINKAGLGMGYYTLDELIGKRLSQVYPGVESMGLLRVLREVYTTGNPLLLPAALYEDSKIRIWRENYIYKLPGGEMVAVFIDKTAEMENAVILNKSREELRKLTGHIQNLREEEKKKIAMEIHDELGQKFAALKMNVSVLQKKLKDNAELLQRANDFQNLLQESLVSMRRIMRELRPGLLDDFGLAEALKLLVKDNQGRSGISFRTQFPPALPAMSKEFELTLYRVIQEAVTNIIRHSGANKAGLLMNMLKNRLIITVSDNGIGIGAAALSNTDSFGITGMRERIESIGGELRITGGPKGTRVVFEVVIND